MIFMSKAMYVLLLADVFENFRSMSLKIYELDPEKKKKKLAPGIALQPVLKNTKVKFVILADVDTLLMAENGIR